MVIKCVYLYQYKSIIKMKHNMIYEAPRAQVFELELQGSVLQDSTGAGFGTPGLEENN